MSSEAPLPNTPALFFKKLREVRPLFVFTTFVLNRKSHAQETGLDHVPNSVTRCVLIPGVIHMRALLGVRH